MKDQKILERRNIISNYSTDHNWVYLVGSGAVLKKYGPDVPDPNSQIDAPKVGISFFQFPGDPLEVVVNEDGVLGTRDVGDCKFRPNASADLRMLEKKGLLEHLNPDIKKLLRN